jgi:putative transposase
MQVQIALSSLPHSAQALYWSKHLAPPVEPASDPLNLAEIPEPLRVEARRRRAILDQVEQILAGPRGLRDEALDHFCRERDLAPRTVYRWRSLYQARGIGALLPKWGATRGQFLALSTPIQQFIKDEYCSPRRPSPTTVYRMVCALCERLTEPTPSQATVNRYLLTLPQPAVVLAREGPRAFRAKMEPKCHRDLNASRPNEWWCGDHREFDVFVKTHHGSDAKVFRPWVTFWYDLGTRTWVGRHVALVPNSDTIAMALRHGILRFGVPEHLYIDNGKDYRCHYLNGQTTASRKVALSADLTDSLAPGVLSPLGVLVSHAIPYQPWSKPIEPAFKHVFTEWEHSLPGYCGRNAQARPEQLAGEIKRDELLTLEEFTERLDTRIEEYHRAEHGELGTAPLAQWSGVSLVKPNPRTLDLLLMRQKSVKVYSQGIKFQGRYYWHDELALHVGHSVEVRFGAELGRVIVFVAGKFLCEATNDPALTMGATREDLAALHRRKQLAKKRAEAQLADRRVLMRPEQELARIAAEARERKVVALPTPPSSPSGATVVAKLLPQLDHAAASLAENAGAPSAPRTPRRARRAAGETVSPAAAAETLDRYDLLNELLAEG